MEVLPESHGIVLLASLSGLREEPDLRAVLDPQELLGELGLLGEDVTEAYFFAAQGGDDDAAFGLALAGPFDVRSAIAKLRKRGWSKGVSANHGVLHHPEENLWAVPLGEGLIVLGQEPEILAAIETSTGVRQSIRSNPEFDIIRDRLLQSSPPVAVVWVLPQKVKDMKYAASRLTASALELAQLEATAELLESLGSFRAFGYSVSKIGDRFCFDLLALFDSESSAAFYSGTLNLLGSVADLVPENGKSQRPAARVEDLSVDREGTLLHVTFFMSPESLLSERSR